MKPSNIIVALFLSGMAVSYLLGYTPVGLALIFLLVSAVTFIVYAKDKHAASKGEWRVSERTLHLLSLLFGWPGAVIAQQSLRHKTRKVGFRVVFWITVVLNASFVSWLHAPTGAYYLKSYVAQIEGFVYANVDSQSLRNFALFLTAYRPASVP